MPITLRNVDTGATRQVEPESPEFKRLKAVKAADGKNPLWEQTNDSSVGAGSHTQTVEATVPAQGTAGAVQDLVVGEVPFAGTVSAVAIVPEAAVAANGTNFRTFRVINKGPTGVGTTVVATFATDTSGLVAFDEKALTLSVVALATTVAADDVLVADEIVAGTGVAHGGYKIVVELSRA